MKFPRPERRSPKARKPLARKAMKRSPRRTKERPEGYESTPYLDAVRSLPFCCCPLPYHGSYGSKEWRGGIVAHHAGGLADGRGGGLKPADDTCIPLAALCHDDWHAARGVFRGWGKAYRQEWSAKRIADTRAIVAHVLAARSAPF